MPVPLQVHEKHAAHGGAYDRERHSHLCKLHEGDALPRVLLFRGLDDDDIAGSSENEDIACNRAARSKSHELLDSRAGGNQKGQKESDHGNIRNELAHYNPQDQDDSYTLDVEAEPGNDALEKPGVPDTLREHKHGRQKNEREGYSARSPVADSVPSIDLTLLLLLILCEE